MNSIKKTNVLKNNWIPNTYKNIFDKKNLTLQKVFERKL